MSHASEPKHLIVNADDFGLTIGVNRGILHAHREGIVTSASLMVRRDAAEDAAQLSKEHPSLAVGIHVDLTEWEFHEGAWVCKYQRVDLDSKDEVRREVLSQIELFRKLCKKDPTHVDSHQHLHRSEKIADVFEEIAASLRVPLRGRSDTIQHCGRFYGQSAEGDPYPDLISPRALTRLLKDLKPGTTELACHPAAEVDFDSTYGKERIIELQTLTEPGIRAAILGMGIHLKSFAVG